jgi:acetolactate synthase-1/2/3 large subunit
MASALMGLVSFTSSHEKILGMMGIHKTIYANFAVDKIDLLLALVFALMIRLTGKLNSFAIHTRIVQMDIDPAKNGKTKQPQVYMYADVKLAFQGRLMEKREGRPDFYAWIEELGEKETKWPLTYLKFEEAIPPQHAIQLLYELTHGNSIITTGVGQH